MPSISQKRITRRTIIKCKCSQDNTCNKITNVPRHSQTPYNNFTEVTRVKSKIGRLTKQSNSCSKKLTTHLSIQHYLRTTIHSSLTVFLFQTSHFSGKIFSFLRQYFWLHLFLSPQFITNDKSLQFYWSSVVITSNIYIITNYTHSSINLLSKHNYIQKRNQTNIARDKLHTLLTSVIASVFTITLLILEIIYSVSVLSFFVCWSINDLNAELIVLFEQ